MKPTVIATSYHTGGVNAISPVIRRLKEEGKADVVVIGYKDAEKTFQNNHISYRTIDAYGLDDVSMDSMKWLLKVESPDLILTGQGCQDKNQPDVIDQTITQVGKEKGIPIISVSDFWTGRVPYFSDIFSENGKFKFLPDRITVLDEIQKDIMIKEGFPEDKLIITGNPHFDNLAPLRDNFSKKDLEQARKDLGLGLDSYVLLYASQPVEFYYGSDSSNPKFLGYTEKTILADLINALDLIHCTKKLELIVKAHPRENESELRSVISEYGKNYPVDKNYDTRKAILASDLILSPFSTALVEATYLDKIGISVQPGLSKDDFLPTNQLGITVPIYKKEDILPTLKNVMFDAEYQAVLAEKRKQLSSDGKAAERVCNLIYEVLK